eukprot:PhF_6_TR22757/c0_g1_i1/m.32445
MLAYIFLSFVFLYQFHCLSANTDVPHITKDNLHVYTTYSNDMYWLFVNLRDSLLSQNFPIATNLHVRVLTAQKQKYKHGSADFLTFCIERTTWVRDTIERNLGQVILFVDVDVQVFPGWIEALAPYVNQAIDQQQDIIFQSEFSRKRGNAGFYFTLGTKGAATFMDAVYKELVQARERGALMHDQDAFYKFQRRREQSKDRFMTTTLPWHLVNAGMGKGFHKTMVAHHAHMSGSYKFHNMLNVLKSKREQYQEELSTNGGNIKLHSGVCLQKHPSDRPSCCATTDNASQPDLSANVFCQ